MMGPLEAFRIEIDNEHIFQPGQQLSGKIILKTKSTSSFTGLWIEFCGRAKVDNRLKLFSCGSSRHSWSEFDDDYQENSELYFRVRKSLFGISNKSHQIYCFSLQPNRFNIYVMFSV